MEQKMHITKENKPKGNIHDTAIRGVLMNKTALAIIYIWNAKTTSR